MTTIGTAVLQIIPSLKGVSDSINKQLASTPGLGKDVGKRLGSNIADGVRGSEPQISAALTQAVNRRGGEKAGQDWADSTASAMAKHLQSAQNTQKLQSSLAYLVKNGDAAGKKFARDMASNLAIELPVQTRAQQVGEKVGAVIGRSIGFGIKAAAAAGIAGIGYTLAKGFERLESIDRATFKLKALGHSGDETKQIMDNALASVKGTSFGLADAATAAASAVAAGIKPGQDLTKYLTEIGDAAAVAGTSFEDMGSIFNKIQTSNKAYTDDLNQLSDKGLPIFTWLQKEYGVTADALTKMVEKGEVDSAHFQKAINDNIGGAAQKMGQSFDGAVKNLEASVARVGANFLTAILGGPGGSALEGPTEAVGRLTEKFDQIGQWVQAHAPQIRQFFVDMVNDIKPVAEALGHISGFLIAHPGLIEAVVIAFAGWKAITVISEVATGLKGIGTALGLIGPAAAAAGAEAGAGFAAAFAGALGPIAVILGLGAYAGYKIWDLPNYAKDLQAQHDKEFLTGPSGALGGGKKWPGMDQGAPPPPGFLEPIPTPGQAPRLAPIDAGITPPATPGVQTDFSGKPLAPGQYKDYPWDPKGTSASAGHATGGLVSGPGSGTSDSILAWISNREFIVNADSTRKFLPLLQVINSGKIPGFSGGGAANGITSQEQQTMWDALRAAFPDAVLTSATRTNQTEGHPDFHNAGRAIDVSGPSMDRIAAWIAQNYPDSLELIHAPFGHNIKNGKDVGDGLGLYGAGTMSGHHDHVHWALGHLARINAAATATTGDNDAASPSFDYAPRNASAGPGAAASVSGGGNSVPSSFSELAGFGFDNLGAGIGKTSSGSDLSLFGKAAGAAVGGQVSSALGVFGAGDSPGWLKGLSTLVGGIKVGGGDGSSLSPLSVGQGSTSSAAPIAASSRHHGVPAPDDAEGRNDIRKGATPGTVYNIRTATVEDAFLHAQRRERERAAAKLDRF